MLNLGRFVARSAIYWPQQEAVVCGSQRWTYADLDGRSSRLASALTDRGITRGDAVGTFSSNRAELVETEIALYKAGLLRVPINARLGVDEAQHILADADVKFLLVDAEHADLAVEAVQRSARDIPVVQYDASPGGLPSYAALLASGAADPVSVDVEEDAPCVLNFTSGSTGKLKAAVQTTGNRLANMRKRLMAPEGAASVSERYLVAGPITHASGMGMLASLSRGSTIVILPGWSADAFLETVARERITTTFLVPTMLNMVLNDPRARQADLSSLQCLRVGGAPISPQRLRDAVGLFGPIVMQGYGQAETTSGVTVLTSQDIATAIEKDPELLLSCGRAVFDTEVQILDDALQPVPLGSKGELAVRGPDCVTSYWNEPDLSAETFRDGWVLTGDIGYMRDDGYIFIVDRKKDMVISGGFNIYCTEVESALYEHPSVSEACVVGIPDDKWGEAVKAVVVLKPGHSLEEDVLVDFCAERLDRFKKPRSVDFVDGLPVNRNGKIDRREIKQRYWAGSARTVN
ncbi:AMP-binding protein [Blastococcus sp. VKM Ac-2987]|uniref:AMP-binding protein n=1 Tax=Blastococcus sp. VKM Ac-2987 TaxID=3004141 RepID=UPI0022AB5DDE|nr:AMP-binding protein [Blastococcus sp. VKM Ac-2987]MCZ2857784.1 AMP-binding protein [Blastococcus sp. VKM Ac-2987]